MKYFVFILFFSIGNIQAQNSVSKAVLKSIFKETLKKSRNFISTATNEWFYDNSNDDYFKRDTIVLNSARSFKRDYCNIVNWSFYDEKRCVIEKADYCNEPPKKNISKNEDFLNLKIKSCLNETYIEFYNLNGLFEKFKVLELNDNNVSTEKDHFDYTIKLLRVKVN